MARGFSSPVLLGLLLASSLAAAAAAQGRRAHTRPTQEREADAIAAREAAISLTVAPVGEQLLQTWIRTAGILDDDRHTLHACVTGEDAALIREGQRIRTFPPDSKSSVYQARVRSVAAGDSCVEVVAELDGRAYGDATRFVMEIIVDRGTMLAVANAAIIERDGVELVYEQIHPGHYEPHEIRTGMRGETYTQVLDGIRAGMPIVTIGSFFVDADYRLHAMPGNGMDAHHHH